MNAIFNKSAKFTKGTPNYLRNTGNFKAVSFRA